MYSRPIFPLVNSLTTHRVISSLKSNWKPANHDVVVGHTFLEIIGSSSSTWLLYNTTQCVTKILLRDSTMWTLKESSLEKSQWTRWPELWLWRIYTLQIYIYNLDFANACSLETNEKGTNYRKKFKKEFALFSLKKSEVIWIDELDGIRFIVFDVGRSTWWSRNNA